MTDIAALQTQATQIFQRKRMIAFGVPVLVLLYLAYVFFAFNMPDLWARASADNARSLVADTYSHKTHVTLDNRSGEVTVAIEGEKKGRYPEGMSPDWVTLGETTVIDLEEGHVVTFGPEQITYDVPDFGLMSFEVSRARGVVADYPVDTLPDWINASKNRVTITTEAGRLTITRNRTEVLRYFTGWELFFFTLDSPYHGLSVAQVMSRAASGEAGAILSDFWNNKMWLHKDVAWAIFETILMAFLGTFGAAIVALPMAFAAARNFAPFVALRFAMRRLFDFFRGVDALIWTIVLTRAFGLGPLTGALAILITDTGTFGKLFSEALENVDEKQIEGIQSTGANAAQKYRFAVIPQIMPVLLSQVLYFLESNTRSATIIGAITGGGIGLLLTQAIITQKDWEEVTYYIVLVVLMVMLMDTFSGWLRNKLIKGQ
ncbi:Phosphonate ABC transporter permease protein phnE1 [Candidatus Rhodobacter oscarellae]|uniref:Phosphonate ABC transporter permease protein phnE1 n=1 Tax=Candidatus Rhodobacter oscarellae TaxID=1675527 RepID=A0A0J9GWV3_9RHOB|nr:phosphonate ABC transporter, permease protein PhnE [Candidatus Rhodobacter lobularis]KMW58018.1 Phosphonate ABC transporter permease protein phnE1 [Candidatus Rhodobacter lobularis]